MRGRRTGIFTWQTFSPQVNGCIQNRILPYFVVGCKQYAAKEVCPITVLAESTQMTLEVCFWKSISAQTRNLKGFKGVKRAQVCLARLWIKGNNAKFLTQTEHFALKDLNVSSGAFTCLCFLNSQNAGSRWFAFGEISRTVISARNL